MLQYLLFAFAGLGVFNGLALTAYLLWRRPRFVGQLWLALLVFLVSFRCGKSVLFYFWPEIPKLALQIGLTACFLIGPALLGFVRAWRDPMGGQSRSDAALFLCLLAGFICFAVLWPYPTYQNLWWTIIQHFWVACIVLSAALLWRSWETVGVQRTVAGLGRMQVALTIAGVAVVWLAYYTSDFTSYIFGALSFTFVVYICVIVVFSVRQTSAPSEPYKDRKIDADEAEAELLAVQTRMEEEQLYKDPSLTITKLARRLTMTPARLSQLLNDNQGTNFKSYLMQVRVDAAKTMLRDSDGVSVEDVAEACGFVSLSTFYTSFKKVQGTTPAAWRQGQKTEG
jgi:AraC-like DNA-binding protein